MLVSLSIKNFVLIEDATLDFHPGLNVLTGETGAGKTLLTRALGLLMGERAEEGLVGKAAPEATIQAVFYLSEEDIAEIPQQIQELLGVATPGELIVTRRLGREGRSRCYVNDTAVTLGVLGTFLGGLISFAGQHEYRRLLDPQYQIGVVDRWAGAETVQLAAEFRQVYLEAKETARRLEENLREQEARRRELELLRYQVAELEQAGLSLEEEAALLSEQQALSRAEEVLASLSRAAQLLKSEEDDVSALELVTRATSELAQVQDVDRRLQELYRSATEIGYQLADLARELRSYASHVVVDPARLAQVNERLRLYHDLARKYGGSTSAALQYQAEAGERLAYMSAQEEDVSTLSEARAALCGRALDLARELTAQRRAALPSLEEAVVLQLADLGMASAQLQIAFRSGSTWGELRENGADSVEFLLQANPGQPPRSLARTASGGELSRVLLAIKCALAGAAGRETLVLDEIDAGIGGRTAVAVANKLRLLSERSQLIVVTHLPQVAALASHHYLIEKTSKDDSTVARLRLLGDQEIVEELCRMLGGRLEDGEAMAHAQDLKQKAKHGLLD